MAWQWQQAPGTVFLESGINSAYNVSVLCWFLEKSVLQPRAVKKKFYLIFAVEDFSIEIIYKKQLSVKYKTEKKWWKNKAKVLAESKGPVYWVELVYPWNSAFTQFVSLCRTKCIHYSNLSCLCLHFLRTTFLTLYTSEMSHFWFLMREPGTVIEYLLCACPYDWRKSPWILTWLLQVLRMLTG